MTTPDLSQVLPGGELQHAEGAAWLTEHRHPLATRHGDGMLGGACEVPPETLAALGRTPGLADVTPRERIWFDTETTSLECGAGVHVFLLGFARIEGEEVVVRQLLMRDPGEERAMLAAFLDATEGVRGLVSYCGKSFDVPRTRDRFVYQALADRFGEWIHFDQYHAARRLWRHRFEDVRLQTLERELLGFHRKDDLPGAECPQQWFALQRGQPHRLADVLRHNHEDVLSLLRLDARLAATLDPNGPDDARTKVLAALLLAEAEETPKETPLSALVRAASTALFAGALPTSAECLRVARMLRRSGAFTLTSRWYDAALEADPGHRGLIVATAIHREHDLRDPAGALALLEAAGACDGAFARRVGRLRGRLG